MATSSRGQANGVLPVTASQTSGNTSKPVASKALTPKLKIIVRRLPPGLTEAEFTAVLGDEWKLGKGRVDWFLYKPGKDSKDPSKQSRPSRAYLHLTNESYLLGLSDLIRQSIFEDSLNTFTNACLIGPPTVEFAPYGRTPGGRRRVDARAGTIDQDPEFMAFLEGLANPTNEKEANSEKPEGGEEKATKGAKVTTTPLVQFLKDKKASKSKDAAVKAAKKQEVAKNKTAKDVSAPEDIKKKGKDGKSDRLVDKAAKEAVKILNREASSKASSAATTKPEATSGEVGGPPKLDLGKVAGRQRGAAISAHIRMLQRDLGLTPAQAHRQVRRDTADAQKAERAAVAAAAAAEKAETDSKPPASQTAQVPSAAIAPKSPWPQSSNRGPKNKGPSRQTEPPARPTSTATPSTPLVLLKKQDSVQPAQSAPVAAPPKAATTRKQPVAVPSDGATQAFVKHANPSQGVTELLLKEAMEKFGPVSSVEIDKRKGFAYVEFVDNEGLKKAMAANPISVAQGTVHVLQRKGVAPVPEKKAPQQAPGAPANMGGRGGGRGGRGSTAGRRGGRGGRGGISSDAARAPSSPSTGPSSK